MNKLFICLLLLFSFSFALTPEEEVNHKIEMILVFMGILAGTFATITAITIGFAIWDRRTMIRPFEERFNE